MYKYLVATYLCWMVSVTYCIEGQYFSCNQSYFELLTLKFKEFKELADYGFIGNHLSSCSSEMECSPGLFCSNKTCKCAHYPPHNIIKCDEDAVTSSILDCYCATVNEISNVTQVGACFYNCAYYNNTKVDIVYHLLARNVSICSSFNRTGAMCGKCLPEHYPLAYSFDMSCILCSHVGWNWARYIMAAYLPLTLFCFFVFFFQINVVTSHLHPVILYSQGVSISAISRVLLLSVQKQPHYLLSLKICLSFLGIWNLDFFRPFYSDICLGIDLLPTLVLDYVIAVYPLLLMATTYLLINLYDKNYRVFVILWKPFRILFSLFKRNWDIKSSLIDSFATFFLLSNVKFLSVSFDLLAPTRMYKLHKGGFTQEWVLYYSGNIKYLGKEHLPYAISALIISLLFVILPILLLALYPFAFFQKCLNKFSIRWHILHTFMDSFNGCYKDGTEPGTRDCRWFVAIFLLMRLNMFLVYMFTHTTAYFSLSAIVFLLLVLLIVNIQPFKARVSHYSKVNATFMTFLAINMIAASGFDSAGIKVQQFVPVFEVLVSMTGIIPIIYVLILVLYWILSHWRLSMRLINWVKAWKRGYVSVGNRFEDSVEHSRSHHSIEHTYSPNDLANFTQ